MEKYYHIYFTLENGESLSIQGEFDDDTVIEDVKEQLKSLYGDTVEELRILEDTGTNGLDEIYDSHNDR